MWRTGPWEWGLTWPAAGSAAYLAFVGRRLAAGRREAARALVGEHRPGPPTSLGVLERRAFGR